MGWTGDFTISYQGDNPETFLKLAKMIIPNSLNRFDFENCIQEGEVHLECTRPLSWYSADEDMKRLVSYLKDGDSVCMNILAYGTYHETVKICKNDGEVLLKNTEETTDRYISGDIGIPEMLFWEHMPSCGDAPELIDGINICDMDGYTQLVANTFAGDDNMFPVVQSYMYEVLDFDRITANPLGKDQKWTDADRNKLLALRECFSSLESTKNFMSEYKKDDILSGSATKPSFDDIPEWLKVYPESTIDALGGIALLQQLIQNRGESTAKELLTMLADGTGNKRMVRK